MKFIKQGIYRIFALLCPLLVIMLARYTLSEENKLTFFGGLTDSVLILALLRFGVNVYLPSCDLKDGKVLISKIYYRVVIISSLVTTVSGAILLIKHIDFTLGWVVAGTCLPLILWAEIERSKNKYLSFYFLKAPVIYFLCLFVVLIGPAEIAAVSILIILSFVIFIISKNVILVDQKYPFKTVFEATIASFLVTAFSWKEALVSKYLLPDASMDTMIFFTRLKIILTFIFMLHNARIPNAIRSQRSLKKYKSIIHTAQENIMISIGWGVISGSTIAVFVYYFENENFLLSITIFVSALITILFGNISIALISHGHYLNVMLCNILGILTFVITIYNIENIGDAEMAIAVASIVAHFSLGVSLFLVAAYKDKKGIHK